MEQYFMVRGASGKKKKNAMIEIYGRPKCGYCDKSIKLAEQYNLKYEYKNAEDLNVYSELLEKIGSVPTVPQIVWNNKHIGGYESFYTEIENTREYGQDGF